jgi:hypothetical protein
MSIGRHGVNKSVLWINFSSIMFTIQLETSKITVIAQALITLGSVNSPELYEQPDSRAWAP